MEFFFALADRRGGGASEKKKKNIKKQALAALKVDGSVVAWGRSWTDVQHIYSTAFLQH